MTTLQIYLLGRFQLIYDGKPVTTIHQPRQQSLLAYLLLHREIIHSRRDITFLFWPEAPERQAFANFRKALHRLRSALPGADQFLHIDPKTVVWRNGALFSLDVTDFAEKLAAAETAWQAGYHTQAAQLWAAAAELYDGELLPNCYDDWLLPKRERLHQQYIGALTQLGDWQETQRDYPAAIRTTRRLLRHDPLYEAAHRRLMQFHLLNDEPAEALRVYHACASLLQQELNVDPSPATREIYDRLLAQTGRSFEVSFQTSQHLSLLPLVGRQTEWQQLLKVWKATSRGPRCAVIAGEAGIGKSRLAQEILLWAKRQGFTTTYSRAYETAGKLAYTPIADWLRSDSLQPAWQSLEPIWLTEIARLLPELLTQHPDLQPPQPLTQSWQRHQLFEALSRAIIPANQPLLLVLDDLQWCDQETLEWLGYLLRFDQQARLLIVGTFRIEEVDSGHPLTALRRDLRHANLLTEIELGALDATETTVLAEQVMGHPLKNSLAEQLYQDTEGNPLFVVETVRAGPMAAINADATGMETVLPPRIQAVIEARLDQLSPPARELVNMAAVIGREFTFELLTAASPADREIVVDALDEAWQRRVIKEQGADAYDFNHDKIREVAYTVLSTARRRWLHQTAAQAIEVVHQPNLDLVSSQLALHYERAGQYEKAVAYYSQAAQAERALGSVVETIALLQRGLEILKERPDTTEGLQQQINFLAMLGEAFSAHKGLAARETGEVYKQALALEPQVGESFLLDLVRFGLGVYNFTAAKIQQTRRLGEQLLSKALAHNDPNRSKLGRNLLGAASFHMGQMNEATQHLEQGITQHKASKAMPQVPNPTIINVLFLALAWFYLGYADRARRTIEEALSLAETLPDPMAKVWSHGYAAWLYQGLGRADKTEQYAQAGLAICLKHDLHYGQAFHTMFKSWALVRQEPSVAEIATFRQGLTDYLAAGARINLSYYQSLLADAYRVTGQREAGLETLGETIALIEQTGERFIEAEIYRLKGELLLAQDDNQQAEAESAFQHALMVARQQQVKSLELRAAMSLARLWQQQGNNEQAYALLSEIYGWFSEGFDTPDLQAAKQLLAQLSLH